MLKNSQAFQNYGARMKKKTIVQLVAELAFQQLDMCLHPSFLLSIFHYVEDSPPPTATPHPSTHTLLPLPFCMTQIYIWIILSKSFKMQLPSEIQTAPSL